MRHIYIYIMAKWWQFGFDGSQKRELDTDLKNPKQWLLTALGGKSLSGVSVTKETSLKFTAVLAAVSLRGSLIASFPKHVFEINGPKKIKITDSLSKLLAYRPNPWMNAYTFWELNSVNLDLWGNAYNIITREKGEIVALSPIHPKFCEPVVRDGKIFYKVSGTESSLDGEYRMMDVLHFKDISTDGIQGKSRITMAAESIGLGLAAEKFGAEFFGKGGHSDAVLETDQILGDVAREQFADNWKRNVNHGTPLLENGIKYKSITIPPEAAQFLATREFQIQDIARVFNVPPPLLYDLSRATFSNIEVQNLQFLTYAMRPTVERFETELEWKLLGNDEVGEKEIRFNMNDLLRGDTAARTNLYASAIANRWMNPNEVRNLENLNPYPEGDKYENPNTSTTKNNQDGK